MASGRAADAATLPGAIERALPLLKPEERPAAPDTTHGYLDLLGAAGPDTTGAAQSLMLTGVVPAIYERWWRPALGRVAKGVFGPGMRDEHRIARLLLGLTPGGRIAIFTSCRTRSAPMRAWDGFLGARSGMRMFERDEVVGELERRGFAGIRQRVSGLTQFVGAHKA